MVAVLLSLLIGLASAQHNWQHDWTTAAGGQFIDLRAPNGYTDQQIDFLATHYAVVSLEKCTGASAGLTTEAANWGIARRLKNTNPKLKVIFYWGVRQQGLHCYAAHDEYANHPEWHLLDDNGNPVVENDVNIIDPTVEAARQWWVSVPLNGTHGDLPLADVIDGTLADGFSDNCPANISSARCERLVAAWHDMVQELQTLFAHQNSGVVVGNGINMYPQSHDLNLPTLSFMHGVMVEHFAVFECVLPSGLLNVTRVNELIHIIQNVVASRPTNISVVVSTWPGPMVQPISSLGPSWPASFGTSPPTHAARRQALVELFPNALASYLILAERNVFMAYEYWYTDTSGALPCPDTPDSCSGPWPWYPELTRPLGEPLGPARQVNGTLWTRHFEHATATLNLLDQRQSRVDFF